MQPCPFTAAEYIAKYTHNFKPKLGLILGSGLGTLADLIEKPFILPYKDIPSFANSTIPGHAGQLVLGFLEKIPVACLQGRVHLYEGISAQTIKARIRSLKLLGCDTLFVTNAAGSLRPEVGPGSLMLITDHINFQGGNPLVGPNDDYFGPRFTSMDVTYDLQLRRRLHSIADSLDIPLAEGVYIAVLGPSFETPAEIRAFRTLGADAVGMSTVPAVLVARHCNLRVAGISVITNFAAGLTNQILSHEDTLIWAQNGLKRLRLLLKHFVASLFHEPC